MNNLSDLKNVKNFLNNAETKRLDFSKKAKKSLEEKTKKSSKEVDASSLFNTVNKFIDVLTQSSASK